MEFRNQLWEGGEIQPFPLSNSEPDKSNSFPESFDTTAAIQSWLVAKLAEQLEIDPQGIEIHQDFVEYGLNSIEAINLSGELENLLGRRLSPTLIWDYPNIEMLAVHLAGEVGLEPALESKIDRSANGSVAESESDQILPEYYRFDLYPEYRQLQQQLEALEGQGLHNPYFTVHEQVVRDTTWIEGRELINYSTYNYLGMSGDPVVSEAAKAAIDRYGTSVSASRLASGEKPLHQELERELADFVGAEEAIVYVGGHATNVTTISHLFGKNDLILHDALSHNSILQGCVLSGASLIAFPHNDWQALDQILQERRYRYKRVLVVIEGVYSMDGDIPNLPKFIEVKQHHKAFLMVDEAHSVGVLGAQGRGIGEYFGVNPADVDLWMGTLSKSFASCGGYIAGCRAVVEYLKYTAPGFVYSVGLSPSNAAATLASIHLLKAEPERVAQLRDRSQQFLELAKAYGLNTGPSKDSAVVPVIVGDSLKCMQLSQALFVRGINVQPMCYPAVPDGTARLRFFISYTHSPEQIQATVEAVVEEASRICPESIGTLHKQNGQH